MKKPMKVIIIVSALLISLLCIAGGILGEIKTGQKSVLILPAAGFLIILALCSWPITAKLIKRVQTAQSPGMILLIIGSVLLYFILLPAGIYSLSSRTPLAFFNVLAGVSLISGAGLIGILAIGLIYWSLSQAFSGKMGARSGCVTAGIAFCLTGLPIVSVMEKYTPQFSSGYFIWFASLTFISLLTSLVVLVAFTGSKLSVSNKVKLCLWILPYTVFSSGWAVLLGQATWIFLHGPNSMGMKIFVGILDPIYVIACLLIPVGIAVWLPDQVKSSSMTIPPVATT